jgi:NDP-sugar pyrophosphorylase family protein
MSKLTAVILAAGENSRFFPLNTLIHKGCISLCGKPLIFLTIEGLSKAGVTNVIIVVSEKDFGGKGISGILKNFVLDVDIKYVLQSVPRGMGDGLLQAAPHIESDTFIVTFPSSLDAGSLLHSVMRKDKSSGAILVSKTDTPWLYGIVSTKGERIIGIIEKPERGKDPSLYKVQGLYFFSKKYLDVLKQAPISEYSFEVALHSYVASNDVGYHIDKIPLPSLKYPWHIFDFMSKLFQESGNKKYIDPSAVIEKNVKIKNSSIEAGVVVKEGATITDSILLEGAIIGKKAQIIKSIIGSHTRIGDGFSTGIEKPKSIVKGKSVDSGLKQMGVIVGSFANIGNNVRTHAGVMIGSNTVVPEGSIVKENIPHCEPLRRKL